MMQPGNEPTTFFITGGAGLIGSYLATKLLAAGNRVIIYDAFKSFLPPWDNPRYHQFLNLRLARLREALRNHPLGTEALTIIEGDIRNVSLLRRSLDEYRPEVIVHLAAIPIADASKRFIEDMFAINLQGTTNILTAAKDLNGAVRRVVYTSSSMAYGDFTSENPAAEDHPTRPLETYGATKLAGEILVSSFQTMFGLETVVIRPSAVYGPTDCNRRIVQRMIESGLEGREVTLFNGGTSRLDFTFVEDVAEGFYLAATHGAAAGGTFNLTRGQGRTLLELSEIVKHHLPDLKIKLAGEDPIKRPERGTLDISRARKTLGYNPVFSLEDGVARYVEFYRHLEA